MVVADLTALIALNTAVLPNNQSVWVTAESANYYLDKTSTATINSPFIVETDAGALAPGRWIQGVSTAEPCDTSFPDDCICVPPGEEAQSLLYWTGTAPAWLAPGAEGEVLQILAGNLTWGTLPAGSITPGPADTMLWSNGVTAQWSANPVLSGSLGIGAAPRAGTGLLRVPHNQIVVAGRNSANSLDVGLVTWGVATNTLYLGDANAAEVYLLSTGNMLRLRSTGAWTNTTGQAILIQPSSSSALTLGSNATLMGQILTNSTASSAAGDGLVTGGGNQGTNAAFTFTGGRGIVRGGAATGAGGGGTYVGGDVWLEPGTGGTRNGNTYVGPTDPVAYNWVSLVGGVALETATAEPTGLPAAGATFYAAATGVLATYGSWGLGATPRATVGLLRFPHGVTVASGRNGANTGDRTLLNWGLAGTDDWQLGDNSSGVAGTILCGSANLLDLQFGSVAGWRFTLTSLVRPTTTGASADMTHRAQGSTAGGNSGGALLLQGGRREGAGFRGAVRLQWNADDATFQSGVELANVVSNNRVVSLARGADLTSVQMPANTGDLVVYIGDAATNPSADAVSGHVYYSDGARPAWRFNATNFRLNGTSATANAGGTAIPTAAGFLDVQINGTQRKIPFCAA